MPRNAAMSWDGKQWRWAKMYRGTRYRVTCEDLGLPREQWSKDASYQAANAWWAAKVAELKGQEEAAHPHAGRLAELERRRQYARGHGLADEAAALEEQAEVVRSLSPADLPALEEETQNRIAAAGLLGIAVPPDADPDALNALFGPERVWRDRLLREPAVPADRTVGGQADCWKAARIAEGKTEVRSAEGASGLGNALGHFTTFVGGATAVDAINADVWHRWYVHCAAQVARRDRDGVAGWSVDHAAKVFGVARSFVRWLWERQVLADLPRNLDSKQFRFQRPAKAIPTFTDAEVRLLLANARGQHRLHLLLMLNVGMTQKDISDLLKSQVAPDFTSITRRRSKTARHKHAPVVTYPLWPETARLLREHLSQDPAVALLTGRSGRRWVRTELREDGTLKKADNVATLFQHLRRKVGLKGEGKSLKVFRKTSATRLKANPAYADLAPYFLGHAARTVADRHYAAPPQGRLAEAVNWLAREFGIQP